MSRWLTASALAAILALVAGCSSGDEAASPPEPLSSAELGWVRAESSWAIDIYDDEIGSTEGNALFHGCTKRLAEVGEPPTERLRAAAEHAAAACALLRHDGSRRQVWDVLGETDDLISPYLRERQPLPLVNGPTSSSRADLHLSELATSISDSDPVEVRCWAGDDFRRVVYERNAWNDYSDTPDDLYGWWDSYQSRIHMRLDQCNTLLRLAHEGVLRWSRDEQVEGADALDTLAHEIQHIVLPDADEAETECAAGRTMVHVGHELGAAPAEVDRLVALYHSDIYDTLDSDYRKDCAAASTG